MGRRKRTKRLIVTFGGRYDPITKGEWGCLLAVVTAFVLFCCFHLIKSIAEGRQ